MHTLIETHVRENEAKSRQEILQTTALSLTDDRSLMAREKLKRIDTALDEACIPLKVDCEGYSASHGAQSPLSTVPIVDP